MPALTLCDLARRGIRVRLLPTGNLDVVGVLTDALRANIRASKAALVAELRRDAALDRLLASDWEPWQEPCLEPGGEIVEVEGCRPAWFPAGAWEAFQERLRVHRESASRAEAKRKRGRQVQA